MRAVEALLILLNCIVYLLTCKVNKKLRKLKWIFGQNPR